MEQLKELKQKGDRDKETLKKAIRAQKERAEKSEEYAEQLHVQLADKVAGRGGPEGGRGGRWAAGVPRDGDGRRVNETGARGTVGESVGKRMTAGWLEKRLIRGDSLAKSVSWLKDG